MEKGTEEQKSKRQMALMMVYGLPIVIVMDFVIAFKVGKWLDLYYASGGNLYRNICLVVAFVVTVLTFLRLTRLGGGRHAK